jgi:hypothetical protein
MSTLTPEQAALALAMVLLAGTANLRADESEAQAKAREALRQKMAEQTDKVGNMQRLYYLPQLRQYTDEGTNLKSVLVQGVELYVLDAGTDRIFHHRLNDTGEALLTVSDLRLVVG